MTDWERALWVAAVVAFVVAVDWLSAKLRESGKKKRRFL